MYELHVPCCSAVRLAGGAASHCLGSLRPGQRTTAEMRLTVHSHTGDVSPKILVDEGFPQLSASLHRLATDLLESGIERAEFGLTIQLEAGSSPGRFGSDIEVRVANGEEGKTKLRVVWEVEPFFEVVPARVFLGCLDDDAQSRIAREIVVRAGVSPCPRVLKVEASSPAVAARVLSSPDASSQRVELSVDASKVSGAFCEEIVLTTDHPEQAIVRVPISAYR